MKGDREHWVTPVAVLPVLTVPHSRTDGEEEATGSSRVGGRPGGEMLASMLARPYPEHLPVFILSLTELVQNSGSES